MYRKWFSLLSILVSVLVLSSCFTTNPTVKPEMQISIPTDLPVQLPTNTSVPGRNDSPTPSAPAADTLFPPFAGIHLHYPVQANWIDAVIQSGTRWTRLDVFFWDKIEPQKSDPPSYDWSQVDEESLIRLSENNIQLIAGILYTPAWAQKYPGVACGPVASTEINRFADFMHAVVARYSQPPYNVKVWEIGNEPDIDHTLVSPRSGFGCWGDASDAYYGGEYYAQVLKAVHPRIKEADPKAHILPGGLLLDCDPLHPPLDSNNQPKNCTAARFLEGFLQAGGGASIDGISFHGYDYYLNELGHYGNPNWNSDWRTTGPVWISKVAYLRSLLQASGLPEIPLYLTELATICGRDGSEEYCQTQDLEQTKAIYAVQSLAAGKAQGLEAIIWFGIEGWRASGMLEGGDPLPIYHAMRFFEANLSSADFSRRIQEFPSLDGYVFTKEAQEIWILWSTDTEEHLLELTGIPSTIYNVEGREVQLQSQNLNVTISPVFLFW